MVGAVSVSGSEMVREVGDITLVGADAPHRELLTALGDTREIMARVLAQMEQQQQEIITLTGGANVEAFSQYPRLRVQSITIVNAGAAALVTVTVGTARYIFAAGIGTQTFDFPLVIERGMNVSCDLVGSIVYLVGNVE